LIRQVVHRRVLEVDLRIDALVPGTLFSHFDRRRVRVDAGDVRRVVLGEEIGHRPAAAGHVDQRARRLGLGQAGEFRDLAIELLVAGGEAPRAAQSQQIDHRRPAFRGVR
jgi:hypothetical protein